VTVKSFAVLTTSFNLEYRIQLRLYVCNFVLMSCRQLQLLRDLCLFENRVLRRIFGPRKDEVTGEWRKLHNEELNDLYCSPSIVRVIK
jgi:hypothetical protein